MADLSPDVPVKKSRWRWVRWVLRWTLRTAAVIGVVLIGLIIWAFLAKPGVPFDADARLDALRAELRPGVVEDPAAWERLLELNAMIAAAEAGTPRIGRVDGLIGEIRVEYSMLLLDPDHPAFGESRYARANDVYERLTGDGAYDTLLESLAHGPVPAVPAQTEPLLHWPHDIWKCRMVADVGVVRLHRAIEDGDTEAAVHILSQQLRFARQLAAMGPAVPYLHGLAIESEIALFLARPNVHGRLDEESLESLVAVIDRIGPFPSGELCLRSEWLVAEDLIQRTFTDSGSGDGRLLAAELVRINPAGHFSNVPRTDLVNVVGLVMSSKARHREQLDEKFSVLIDLARAPVFDWQAADRRRYGSPNKRDFALLFVGLTARQTAMASPRVRLELAGARQLLEIERYRARTGALPESLEQMAAETGRALSIDPMTGESFRYVHVDPAEDPEGREYLLYAIGWDGRDDGGTFPLPLRASSRYSEIARGDYVINTAARCDYWRGYLWADVDESTDGS